MLQRRSVESKPLPSHYPGRYDDPDPALLIAAKRRYDDFSDRLAVLMYLRDLDRGTIADEVRMREEDPNVGADPDESLCPEDLATVRREGRPFADLFLDKKGMREYAVYDETHRTQAGPSLWYIKEGALWQGSLIAQQRPHAGQKLARRGSMLLRKGRRYSRFILTVHFARHRGRPVRSHGIIFCAQDDDNYYLLLHEPAAGPPPQPVRLIKVCNDVFQQLAEIPAPLDISGGVEVEITRVAGNIRVNYGGCCMEVRDTAHQYGSVGLLAHDNDSLCVDLFSCRAWVPQVDRGVDLTSRDMRGCRLPPEKVLLYDPFTDPDLGAVAEVIDYPGIGFGPGMWSRGGGVLRQNSNAFLTEDYDDRKLEERGTMLIYKDPILHPSVRYRLHVGGADGQGWDGFGFVFNFKDERNFYLLREARRYGVLRLICVVDGRWKVLAKTEMGADAPIAGQSVDIRITRVWRNNSEYVQRIGVRCGKLCSLRVQDSTFELGRCGFHCFAAPHFEASFLQVTETIPENPRGSTGSPLPAHPTQRAVTAPAAGTGPGRSRLLDLLSEQRDELAQAQALQAEVELASSRKFSKKVPQGRGREAVVALRRA
eukprot:Hpha_TRINITY_DN10007_c0_g1::TRINITY_DN10007_c0_g1_i1::g.83870::m.83870